LRTIVVTGGTGFVGRRLLPRLIERGDQAIVLGRRSPDPRVPVGARSEPWTPEQRGDWYRHIDGASAVIHLAGEPVVAGRWTESQKERIYRSRIESTRQLVAALREAKSRPTTLLCASAVGYYGGRSDDAVVDESSPPGDDFLAHVVRDWEHEASKAEELGVRVVRLRIGLVLGDEGGVLGKMLPAFRMFAGGPVGPGGQVMPWVHVDDTVGLILFALDNEQAKGAINVTAPAPVTMDEFARELGRALGRPSLLRVPSFAIKAMLGEAATPVLTGQRALPREAGRLGYQFRFPALPGALADLFGGRR